MHLVRARRQAAELLVTAVLLLGIVLGAGWLVTAVEAGSGVEEADVAAVRWLAARRTPALDTLSGPAGELGNTAVVIGVGLVAAAAGVALLRQWWPLLLLAVAVVGELLIFLAATAVINRPRPPVAHLDAQLPPTSSFPSGHVGAALCLWGGIAALVLVSTHAWWRWLVLAVAVAVVVLVALTRLYRGAHYPTDVLAGALFAGLWLLATVWIIAPRSEPAPAPLSVPARGPSPPHPSR